MSFHPEDYFEVFLHPAGLNNVLVNRRDVWFIRHMTDAERAKVFPGDYLNLDYLVFVDPQIKGPLMTAMTMHDMAGVPLVQLDDLWVFADNISVIRPLPEPADPNAAFDRVTSPGRRTLVDINCRYHHSREIATSLTKDEILLAIDEARLRATQYRKFLYGPELGLDAPVLMRL